MENIFARTSALLGAESMEKLKNRQGDKGKYLS